MIVSSSISNSSERYWISSIDKQEVIGLYIEAYNTFDIDSMLTLIHPDIRFTNLSSGKITAQTAGKSECESLARQLATLFRTRAQTIKSLKITGDKVIAAIHFNVVLAWLCPSHETRGFFFDQSLCARLLFSINPVVAN